MRSPAKQFRQLLSDLENRTSYHKKFSRVLVLIGLTSTRDAQGIEMLCTYDEGDVISLVQHKMHQLRGLPPKSSTRKHHIALIRSVFELCSGMKDHRQWELLDTSRTFRENRQLYLSMLGINADATCVDITEASSLIKRCKVFQLQPGREEAKELEGLINPSYLPIRPLQPIPWEAACNLSYGVGQRFAAFTGSIAHQFSYNDPSEPDYLFIIFQRLENIHAGLPDEYVKLVQSRLANKIRDCTAPNKLVVYVLAAFALSQNEATLESIHEFANEETYDVSRATVTSMTRALDQAMRSWPTQAGWAIKFVSTLLGEGFDGKGSGQDESWDKY